MKSSFAHILWLSLLLLTGCEKWYKTEDVSHVSYLPEFTLQGGEFISVRRQDSVDFEEPGVSASSNGKVLNIFIFGEVDLSKTGVYLITYYARNEDGLTGSTERIISVTEQDVSSNDLSGTYVNTTWGTVESKVKKIDVNGLYKCEDVLGFPGAEMSGRFVDIGDNELVLLPGEGYFGRYESSEGVYSQSILSWKVSLTDPPNEGVQIIVTWRKKKDE